MCGVPQTDLHADLRTLSLPALQPGLSGSLGTTRPAHSAADHGDPASLFKENHLSEGCLTVGHLGQTPGLKGEYRYPAETARLRLHTGRDGSISVQPSKQLPSPRRLGRRGRQSASQAAAFRTRWPAKRSLPHPMAVHVRSQYRSAESEIQWVRPAGRQCRVFRPALPNHATWTRPILIRPIRSSFNNNKSC